MNSPVWEFETNKKHNENWSLRQFFLFEQWSRSIVCSWHYFTRLFGSGRRKPEDEFRKKFVIWILKFWQSIESFNLKPSVWQLRVLLKFDVKAWVKLRTFAVWAQNVWDPNYGFCAVKLLRMPGDLGGFVFLAGYVLWLLILLDPESWCSWALVNVSRRRGIFPSIDENFKSWGSSSGAFWTWKSKPI